jgi:hypothetical protein
MVYTKRLIWAILLGLLFGAICAKLGQSNLPSDMTRVEKLEAMLSVFFDRALIGLLIGVSAWRMPWMFHGIIMGILGSLVIAPYSPVIIPLFGIVWGFLIELLLNLVFKAPMKVMVPVTTPKVE